MTIIDQKVQHWAGDEIVQMNRDYTRYLLHLIKERVLEEAVLLWACSKWKLVTWLLQSSQANSKAKDPAATPKLQCEDNIKDRTGLSISTKLYNKPNTAISGGVLPSWLPPTPFEKMAPLVQIGRRYGTHRCDNHVQAMRMMLYIQYVQTGSQYRSQRIKIQQAVLIITARRLFMLIDVCQ